MKKRTDLFWRGGNQTVICDIEMLRHDGKIYFMEYEQETEEVHSEFGGKNYYVSCSGLSGAGYADLPSFAFPVNTYRIDTKRPMINRVTKAQQLTWNTYNKNLFLSIYYPIISHEAGAQENIYFVLQAGTRDKMGTPEMEQCLFLASYDYGNRGRHRYAALIMKAILEAVEEYNSNTEFGTFCAKIADQSGMTVTQSFAQSYLKENGLKKDVVWHWCADRKPDRKIILNFLDTRFLFPDRERISAVHSAFDIYRYQGMYGAFSWDGRLLFAYGNDPLLHGFESPDTEQVIPVEKYQEQHRIYFISTKDKCKMLAKRGRGGSIYCMAYMPTSEFDLSLLPDAEPFWEYEEIVPQLSFGYDWKPIHERLTKALHKKRRKALLSVLKIRRANKSINAFVETHPQIEVFIHDSVDAGNCRLGTYRFRDQYFPGKNSVTLAELAKYASQHHVATVIRHIMAKEKPQPASQG